jgi:N-acetylmuramic acid 6-phosphate (MurNAc-6-P) etherase
MDEEKVMQRIEHLVLDICGCTRSEAIHILKKTSKRLKNMSQNKNGT